MMNKAKKIYKLSGMHCTSCSLVIEGELEDIGVEAVCSYARQVVEVIYDTDKVNDRKIVEIIEKEGYKVVGRG